MSASLFFNYTQLLLSAGRKFLLTQLQENSFITPEDLFGIAQVNQIMLSFKEIGTEEQCRHIIGGEYVDVLAAEVFRTINDMKMSPMYVAHIAWVQQNKADDTLVKTANYRLTKYEIIRKNFIKAAHLADQAEVLLTQSALERNLKRLDDQPQPSQPVKRKQTTAAALSSASLIDPGLIHIV
jgi:hypothetical protein